MRNIVQRVLSNIANTSSDRVLLKNISGAFLFKGLGIILSFLSLPIYMDFFENRIILGVWFTILSISNWIFMFDVGIGNGLRNCLTRELVRGDKKRIRTYISSAYIMIMVIAAVLLCAGLAAADYVDWNIFFNVSDKIVSADILKKTVKIIYVGIILQFVFKLVAYILYALQKSAINNMIAFLVSLLQLIAVLIMPSASIEENLIRLAIVNSVLVNVLYIGVTVYAFYDEKLKGCGISLKYFEKSAAKLTVNVGILFLWTQILHLLIVLTDDYLVTRFTSPEYEVHFSIYFRFFSLVSTLFLLALTPVWSAVTKAQEEKDYVWIKKIYRYANIAVLIGILGEFLIIGVLQFGINIWLGKNAIEVNYLYAFIFAIYGSIMTVQSVQETFSYGFGKVMVLCICYTIGVVIKFSIVYFGTMLYPDAWIIVVVANICVILPYCLIQPYFLKREIEKLKPIPDRNRTESENGV